MELLLSRFASPVLLRRVNLAIFCQLHHEHVLLWVQHCDNAVVQGRRRLFHAAHVWTPLYHKERTNSDLAKASCKLLPISVESERGFALP